MIYEQIDSVTGTKDDLFVRSKIWLTNTFNSAKSVIQLDDKEAGKLMGKVSDSYYFEIGINKWPVTANLNFTFQIDVRDNKARIRILNIEQGHKKEEAMPIEKYEYIPRRESH